MSTRPLAWLAAAGGLAALALAARPDAEPVAPSAAPADGPAAPVALPRQALSLLGAGAKPFVAVDPTVGIDDLARRLLSPDAAAALPQLEALARQRPDLALPLYEQLLERWATLRQFPQALQTVARAPLDDDTRDRLQQKLLARWAEAAPDQAARWALATPGQADLLAPLQDRWLQQDARSATAFASTLPPGEQRQALLDESLSRWTAQDGPAARDWLRSQGSRPELDEAIARHASADELARNAPDEAMDLVARIATPERRWQAWQALTRTLGDIDAEQVAPLLARAPGLTPADRARLLDELRAAP